MTKQSAYQLYLKNTITLLLLVELLKESKYVRTGWFSLFYKKKIVVL